MAKDGAKKLVIVKKKKIVGGGHHGGSWKVAYADFVTAMMAFFMVMWILGMDDKTKEAIEGYFSNPVGYKKGFSSGSSPIADGSSPARIQTAQLKMIVHAADNKQLGTTAEQVRETLSKNDALAKLGAKVDVAMTKEGLRIELIESGKGDVFFASGSTQMRPAAVVALQAIAPELAPLPNPIVVEGHTDAARFGSDAAFTNWELSAERANAARRVLLSSGITSDRIAEVRGLADRHLRVPEAPLDPSNRRISLLIRYRDFGPEPATAEAADTAPSIMKLATGRSH